MKLSIIIPVYNEERTVIPLLEQVINVTFPKTQKEIIVVNDGSTDSSHVKISHFRKKNPSIKYIKHEKNAGKGAAVVTGIQKATGEYIVIQDADLEYNPRQIAKLLKPIHEGRATVVYGTRLKRLPNLQRDERTPLFLLHYVGNRLLSLATSAFYFQWITDMETCYKVFPRATVMNMTMRARGFEFEPEITAKLLKKGHAIIEIPITTTPRSYAEGKKLNTIRDGARALFTVIKYRFID